MSDSTTHIAPSPEILQLISAQQAWHYRLLPVAKVEDQLKVVVAQSLWTEAMKDELEIVLGLSILPDVIADNDINQLLARYYRQQKKNNSSALGSEITRSDDFLLFIIHEANNIGSSDIHFEKYEDRCRVRLRIDGKLSEKYIVDKTDYPAMINKIKIKARLDIAEKRLPQDGRIEIKTADNKFDIRVSVLPTLYGEKVVLRLLSRDATDIDLAKLGFNEKQLNDFKTAIQKPNGMVLISGPTGSGKTTTLYASLKILNNNDTNILTIEDPIEYTLEGINQVQLREDIGLGFTDALRSFLRQDPDIIMLGEIRDQSTAQMAIRAALTGHLVLSTIHTNSAWGTVSRLVDMGIPPFLLASTLNATVAQRLVRLLCTECNEIRPFQEQAWNNLPADVRFNQTHHPVGCEHCHHLGYSGRKAVYEVIPLNQILSEKIKQNEFIVDDILKDQGILKMRDQALALVQNGNTSLEEVYNLLTN